MADISVGLDFETTEAEGSLKKVGESAVKMGQSVKAGVEASNSALNGMSKTAQAIADQATRSTVSSQQQAALAFQKLLDQVYQYRDRVNNALSGLAQKVKDGSMKPEEFELLGEKAGAKFMEGVDTYIKRSGLTGSAVNKLRDEIGIYVPDVRNLDKVEDANKKIASSSSLASLGLGRLRYGFISLIAQATGTIPVMDRVIGAFLMMGLDGKAALGVLGALAAIALAYKFAKGPADELKKANDELVKSMENWYKAQHDMTGPTSYPALEAMDAQILKLEKDLDGLNNGTSFKSFAELFRATMAGIVDVSVNSFFMSYMQAVARTKKELGIAQKAEHEAGVQRFEDVAKGEDDKRLGRGNAEAALVKSGYGSREDLTKSLTDYKNMLSQLRAEYATLKDAHEQAFNLDRQQRYVSAINSIQSALHDQVDSQIREQTALNSVMDDGALAIQLMKDKQEALNDVEQYALDHSQALTDAYAKKRGELEKLAEAQQINTYLNEEHAKTTERLAGELSKTQPQWTLNRKSYEDQVAGLKAMNEEMTQLPALLDKNLKKIKESIDASAEKIKQAQQYSKDLQNILKDGIEHILTNGSKSWQNFFDDIFQMFNQLMERMEKRAKENHELNPSGFQYNALRIGEAAAATAAIYQSGVQIGRDSGGNATKGGLEGGLNGAVSGAVIGNSLLPGGWGAAIGGVVGGLSGLIGGITGAGKAAKEAAIAFQLAQASINAMLDTMAVGLRMGSPLQAQLASQQSQFLQMQKQINDGLAGKKHESERNADLAQLNQLEAVRIQQIKDEYAASVKETTESLQARILRAEGNEYEANMLDLQVQQQKELQQAMDAGWTDQQIAMLKQAQAAETLRAAMDSVTNSITNQVAGYKLLLANDQYLYQPTSQPMSVPAPGSSSSSTGAASGSGTDTNGNNPQNITVNLTVNDKVLATTVVKSLQSISQKQYGTSARWSEVQV